MVVSSISTAQMENLGYPEKKGKGLLHAEKLTLILRWYQWQVRCCIVNFATYLQTVVVGVQVLQLKRLCSCCKYSVYYGARCSEYPEEPSLFTLQTFIPRNPAVVSKYQSFMVSIIRLFFFQRVYSRPVNVDPSGFCSAVKFDCSP